MARTQARDVSCYDAGLRCAERFCGTHLISWTNGGNAKNAENGGKAQNSDAYCV